MPRVSFNRFHYFPEITASWPERTGFVNLSPDDKQSVLLTFLLGQVDNNSPDLGPAIRHMRECVEERPFLIDLLKHLAPAPYEPAAGLADARAQERYNREADIKQRYDRTINDLTNPADGFAAWRAFVGQWPNAVPVIQFTQPRTQARNILRQATMLSAGNQSIAIRLNRASADELYPIISNIFAVVERPSRILFILDMGQARSQMQEREAFVTEAVTQISALVDARYHSQLRFVSTGGSYPQSTPNGLHERNIHEREIWNNLTEATDIRYGDYASMHRLVPTTTFRPSDFRAAASLPLNVSWLCWRSENANDTTEWQTGAQAIVEHNEFDGSAECWGKEIIRRGAAGDTNNIEANRHWIAARINMHIKTQIEYISDLTEDDIDL